MPPRQRSQLRFSLGSSLDRVRNAAWPVCILATLSSQITHPGFISSKSVFNLAAASWAVPPLCMEMCSTDHSTSSIQTASYVRVARTERCYHSEGYESSYRSGVRFSVSPSAPDLHCWRAVHQPVHQPVMNSGEQRRTALVEIRPICRKY